MDQNIEMLKENRQQQEMLDEILRLVAKAAKDEFPAYLKLIQMDVFRTVREKTLEQGTLNPATTQMVTNQIDAVLNQIGKDLEKNIEARYAATREELCK